MENKICIKDILNGLKTDEFVLNSRLPSGYGYGYPILQVRNDYLCMVVPYLRYKTTGVVDRTLVFPIRNTFTISLPDKRFIGFEDLRYNPRFAKVDFSMPIGLFRHESIKNLSKKEYEAKREELYAQYDKLINALLFDGEYSEEDGESMKQLLKLLVEPSLYPIYKALDADFYNKYLA